MRSSAGAPQRYFVPRPGLVVELHQRAPNSLGIFGAKAEVELWNEFGND
jgi:hypothetical protein